MILSSEGVVRVWQTLIVCSFFLQIAIMGCIVNGPGEMADADFGYVGGAPGKIDLYVGKVSFVSPAEMTACSQISFHKFI